MTLGPGPEDPQSFLNVCLLEGDADLEKRARRGKRRAIVISIVLQILFVAALILLPLLGKSENIAARVLIYPGVPYRGQPHRSGPQRPTPANPAHPECHFCQPTYISPVIVERDLTPAPAPDEPVGDTEASRFSIGDTSRPGVPFTDSTRGPKPPDEPPRIAKHTPTRFQVSGPVQEARLIHRVQPVYPPLAIQLRREGRVELHAVIATDGSIQSLEVLSGDPLLIQSALAAVREWHYQPTTLNGEPVEVDTHITVIYTLSH